MRISDTRTPANDGNFITYDTREEAEADRRFFAAEGHETTAIYPAIDGNGYSFAVRDLWDAKTGGDWNTQWEHTAPARVYLPEPDNGHRVAPDRGRNIHCTCGAEFSYARNLMAHIEVENLTAGYTGDGGGRYVSSDAPGAGNYFRGAHDAYNGEG